MNTELNEAASEYSTHGEYEFHTIKEIAFKAGVQWQSEQKQDDCLCALKIPVNENERVNVLLIGALRFLNEEQMIALRDALIARTPKAEQKQSAGLLKDTFDAGYDYRSSLLPEIIAELGENSMPTFEEWIKTRHEIKKQLSDEEIKKLYPLMNGNGDVTIQWNDRAMVAREAFKSALQYSVGDGWIDVKNLPEVGKQVLIFEPPCNEYDEGNIQVSFYAGKKPSGKRYWYEWPDGQDEQPSSYFPTHWRPLPSPPINK